MPAHFKVAPHDANPVRARSSYQRPLQSPLDLVYEPPPRWSIRKDQVVPPPPKLIQSTFDHQDSSFTALGPKVTESKNGFVDTVINAYNDHQHLVLRPDDVWIAILSQFNIYVNAHSEELRSHFVAHEGKKKLEIMLDLPLDFAKFATMMSEKIAGNITDPDLKDWILPQFTTTTHNDTVVSAVMMMSTLKAYFDYFGHTLCGLPSVTLEGEKSDWENILSRINKLPDFGPEPAHWATLLRPILTRFVQAFDGNPDLDFWGRVCSLYNMGSGPTYLSGWITAFCVWADDGRWRGNVEPSSSPQRRGGSRSGLTLDSAQYPVVDLDRVPSGSCEVDVVIDGVTRKMVSGHVACCVEGERRDTLRPFPAWFILSSEAQ